jgi:hypothetical protein
MSKINFKRTTKRRSLLRTLPILALALIMSLAGVSSVFAATDNGNGGYVGDADDQVAVAITKVLQMPTGTTTPAATFDFAATPVSFNGDTSATASMPSLAHLTGLAISGGVVGASGDKKTVTLETANIFDNVGWGSTGHFVYTITEAIGDTSGIAAEDPDTDSMTYSGASYTLDVWVAHDSTVGYYVAAVTAKIVTTDPGTTGTPAGTKVDPTPGTPPEEEGGTSDHPYSELAFTNSYIFTENGEGEPEDPEDPGTIDPDDAALVISSAVAGELADPEAYFPYAVTITKNSMDPATAYYAYILDKDGDVKTGVADDPNDNPDPNGLPAGVNYVTFTAESWTNTVNLQAGEKLVFISLPVGTGWTAVDTLAGAEFSPYTPSATGSFTSSGSVGVALSTGSLLVADGGSSAAFLNTYDLISPTGLIINNLPYIMLVLLAIAILAAYVVGKSRRRRYNAE